MTKQFIGFNVSPEQKKIIEDQAREIGLSTAGLSRMIVLNYCRKEVLPK